MIYHVTNEAGHSELVIADSPKDAKQRARISNPNRKRSDLDVKPAACEHGDHWNNAVLHGCNFAVAFVRKVPMCAHCIETISKPLDERVAELEVRVAELEKDNTRLWEHSD